MSAVAANALNEEEHIRFQDAEVLATTPHYHTYVYCEAYEIQKHRNNGKERVTSFKQKLTAPP